MVDGLDDGLLAGDDEVYALSGVIRKRQGTMREAAESFYQALKQAEVVLNRTPPYYRGLDAMGLSYSGTDTLRTSR